MSALLDAVPVPRVHHHRTPLHEIAVPQCVVLDTCVLISNVVRFSVLTLACEGCFSIAWSPIIGDEWRRNAARLWSVDPLIIAEQWESFQTDFPFACQGDVEVFKSGLKRSDPKDWHVVAAGRAVLSHGHHTHVDILTRNIKDFNRSELRQHGLGLLDPDTFLVRCLMQFPQVVCAMLRQLPQSVIAPDRTPDPLPVILKRERLFRLQRLLQLQDRVWSSELYQT